MLDRLRNALFYSGAEKQTFEMAKPKILETNRVTVSSISCCAIILTMAMSISTFFVEGVAANRAVYALGIIASFGVFTLATTVAKEKTWMVMPLVYLADFVFYMYGILIGTITDPSEKTVTFIVMLVFLPILFTDIPIRQIVNTAIYEVIFITLCFRHKTGAVLQNDIVDAIVFGVLGVISGAIINQIKTRGYVLELKLKRLSQTDELTQLNNRHFYEQSLGDIYNSPKTSIACVYIDVNGLHELNNSRGHDEGDEMLKFIAIKIREFFGKETTFRFGGDEFIIFVLDEKEEKLDKDLLKMNDVIENAGYHIAMGVEYADAQQLPMHTLVSSAEYKMFQDKENFYQGRSYERRKITKFRERTAKTRP